MLNDDVKDEELDAIIEFLKTKEDDIEKFMDNNFQDLVFLGSTISTLDSTGYDCAMLSMRICIRYFLNKEDYLKVRDLKKVLDSVNKPEKRIVEVDVLKDIVVNLN